MEKVAVITGAGAGIGQATAQAFLGAGWTVALLGRRLETLQQTVGEADNAHCVACDVSVPEQVEAVFAGIAETLGRIDVLFNNAGIGVAAGTIDEISVADWKRVVDINLTGTFLCARAAFAQMRAQSPQGGRIINNGSISAYVPRPGSTPYTATKHGVTGLTRTISLDGRPFNICCGQIDIGNARTAMVERMQSGTLQADGSTKTEPTMDVAHVASSVLHMASLPLEANVQFMTVMASNMPYIGRG